MKIKVSWKYFKYIPYALNCFIVKLYRIMKYWAAFHIVIQEILRYRFDDASVGLRNRWPWKITQWASVCVVENPNTTTSFGALLIGKDIWPFLWFCQHQMQGIYFSCIEIFMPLNCIVRCKRERYSFIAHWYETDQLTSISITITK